jgi:hypothetical protein
MLNDLWRQFLTLPQWQQAGGTALALTAVWVAGRSVRTLLTRSSRRTLYVLDDAGHRLDRPPSKEADEPPEPQHQSAEAVTTADVGSSAADEADTGTAADAVPSADARTEEPANSDWANNRRLCACCGYPTAMDEFNNTCALCDWTEPEADVPPLEPFSFRPAAPVIQPGVGAEERDVELVLAKQNFAKYGSALSPDDRKRDDLPISNAQLAARRQLRERFEYLKTDPPDISETWDTIDRLITELREENA